MKFTKKTLASFAGVILFFGLITTILYSASVTNGSVTIDVVDYDAGVGWTAGVVYDAKVTVDFADTSSIDKTIIITLPEGMRFVNYPVKGTPTAGTPGYELDAGSVLAQFIVSTVDPPKQTYYPSYNGALTYTFTTDCESIEVPLKITVDENVYYGPKTITNAINATASKGVTNLGDASMDVDGVGSVSFVVTHSGWINPIMTLAGSTDPVYLQRFSIYRPGILYPTSFYIKEYDLYYYYPKELENITPWYPDTVVEINNTEGYFRSVWNNRYGRFTMSATAYAENVPAGLYTSNARTTFKLTMYDDTIINVTGAGPTQVDVLASVDNKLEVVSRNVSYYEQSDDYYIAGPRFRIVNDEATNKESQYVEYTIDPNYEVIQAVFPKDPTLGVIGDVEYKTNLNSTIRIADPSDVIAYGTTGAYISNESLGLSANEYITYVNASIGGVSKGFRTQSATYLDYLNVSSRIIGKLKDGIDTANITMRTYARLPDNSVEPDSESSVTAAVNRIANPTTSIRAESSAVTMNAGETKNISFVLNGSTYYYGNTLGMLNPNAYIRIPENTEIDLASITATSNYAGVLPITVTGPYTSAISGEEFVEVAIIGKMGSLFELEQGYAITLNFDFIAGLGAGGNYAWEEYVFWNDNVGDNYVRHNTYSNIISDTMDIDNDGSITDKFAPADDKDLLIISKEEMLIDTYIVPEGETRRPPYDGTPDTVIGFTPGTTAKYTLDFLNNRTDNVNSLESYFPVPKDGNNYGTNFQENEFYWNMKLGGTPTVTVYDQFGDDITATAGANYALSYSEDATTEANYQGATYTGTSSDNTTMIKVINSVGIAPGENAILEFDYVVDETLASVALDPSKLGAVNDFRPYYYFNSGTSGWQSGARVGASLEIGQIAGQAFTDIDRDGIYTDTTDTLLENKTVDLYKKDGTYSFIETTTTDTNGLYEFNELSNGVYKVDFNNIKTAQQEFTHKNQGSDETLDSDVDYTGVYKGTIEDIDSTVTTSRNIDAGIIEYDYANDLQVSLNKSTTNIKLTTPEYIYTEQLVQSILPTYFEDINAITNDITWSSSDPSTVSVSNGLIQGAQIGTATITVTIEDMYGNTNSANTVVTVIESEPNVITTSATNITETTATLNADITNTGGDNPERFLQWGRESGNYTNECSAGIGATGTYSCNITSLLGNTIYYVRSKAVNSVGTSYGDEVILRTTMPSEYAIFNPNEADMENYVNEGYFTLTSGTTTSTDEVNTNAQIVFKTTNGELIIPDDTNISEQGNNNFNFSKFMMQNVTNAAQDENPNYASAVRFGVPNISLDFSNQVTVKIYVSDTLEGKTLQVSSQEEGSSTWNNHAACTVLNATCTFTTNHATSYVVDGDGTIVQGEDTTQDVSVTIATVIQLDCYDKLLGTGNTIVDLGVIIPGIAVSRVSTCDVSTNDENGYYLSIKNNNSTQNTMISGTQEIVDLTRWDETTMVTESWTPSITKGFGFSVIKFPQNPITHNEFDGVWNITNQCPSGASADTNSYAGIPQTAQAISAVTEYKSTLTSTDVCHKLDVLSTQPSGIYTGSVTYTATSDASGYYQ